jgi:hypothetical protein
MQVVEGAAAVAASHAERLQAVVASGHGAAQEAQARTAEIVSRFAEQAFRQLRSGGDESRRNDARAASKHTLAMTGAAAEGHRRRVAAVDELRASHAAAAETNRAAAIGAHAAAARSCAAAEEALRAQFEAAP